MRTKVYYEGPVTFKLNGETYIAEVKAVADYWYQPCVMYFKDGSGQPEDWEYEINELKILSLEDTNGIPYIETYNTNKDFKDDVDEAVSDELMEMSEWEFPEDYEPEPPEEY